jgi:RNA polymerase sigma factor (sigma-70 family)
MSTMDHDQSALTDGQLLAAFCGDGREPPTAREAAFAAVVRRHGAMVGGVCRRIVGGGAEADDAAQAVFLALALKARTLRRHPTLGGWLHRAAHYIALRQRDALRARRHHEEVSAMTPPAAADALDERLRLELREELDHALDRLSERYRLPLVLHYLEGRSPEEIATLLKLKPGTLASLLSRGRDLLREQLERRGVVVGAVALTALLTGEASAAVAPSAVAVAATAKAALAVSGGTLITAAAVGVTPQAAALATSFTPGVMTTMTIIKITGAAALAAALLTFGATTWAVRLAPAAEPPAAVAAEAPVADDPAAAVLKPVKALRANDAAYFLGRLKADQHAMVERMWQGTAERLPALRDGAAVDLQLAMLLADNGADQLMAVVTPLLAQVAPQEMAARLNELAGKSDPSKPRPEGQPPGWETQIPLGGIVGGLLAAGQETAQIQVVRDELGDLATWIATAGFEDPAKARKAIEALIAGLKYIQVKSAADLRGLELPGLAVRLGQVLPQVKAALAVYGLPLDQILDSVKVIAVKEIAGEPDARLLTVGFTAFGKERTIPIKVAKLESAWQVVADSPLLAWLRPRFGGRGGWGQGGPGGPGGQGGRGGRGGRGGPGGGRGGAPADPAPAPATPTDTKDF